MKLLLGLVAGWVAFGQATASSLSFEVASIKPAHDPDDDAMCDGGPGTRIPGQYECSNSTIRDLVRSAFYLRANRRLSPAGPQTGAFDIAAKVPAGTTSQEQCRLMLQNLLIERFKLAYHWEKQETDGYELVVGKNGPKLKESPPESPPAADHASASPSPQPPKTAVDSDGFTMLPPARGQMLVSSLPNGARRMTYTAVTLEQVLGLVRALLGRPVIDRTGLTGKYDVAMTFMDPKTASRADVPTSADGGAPQALNENDAAPPLPAAIEQQLGLKLERKKVTLDVLVIDHAEKTPTEN